MKINILKKKIFYFLIICLTIFNIYIIISCAQTSTSEVHWQSSESIIIKLGVRDKYGTLKSYDANFVVTDPEGKQFETLKKVIDDEWGYAHFPDDFAAYAKSGKYSWKCIVNDRPVIQGEFEYIGYSGEAKILR